MSKTPRFPSIDGWRAVSIILVLGYHCQFAIGFPSRLAPIIAWLFDGNLGVRFFFVISGFLITHLLLQEYDHTGGVSLRAFYIRRALRILPVYYVYLLVIFVLQFLTSWYQPSITWLGNLTFTTNVVPMSNQTTHLWSLAVEEQFYLLWPMLLVWVGLKGNDRKLLRVLGIPLVVAPICRVLSHMRVSSAIFALFQDVSFLNNFDSLAVGCSSAILLTRHELRLSAMLNRVRWESISLGVILILIPYIATRLSILGLFTVPFGNSCQAIGFAILLLQSIVSPQLFKPLNWAIIKKVGILSYSIYIWQQIFLCNPQNFGFPKLWFMSFPGALLTTILVAALSFYGLEKPFMRLRAYFRNAGKIKSLAERAARTRRWGQSLAGTGREKNARF